MSLKQEIEDLVKKRKKLVPVVKAIEAKLEQSGEQIAKYIKKAWDKDHSKVCLHAYGYYDGFYINVPGYEVSGHNTWFKPKYSPRKQSILVTTPPVSLKSLREFAKRMSEELGIPVREAQSRIPTAKQVKKQVKRDGFSDFYGANIFHGGDLTFVQSGNVFYKGWDIGDPFLICRRKSTSKLLIAYSTTGHGGGFDTQHDDPTKEELSGFFDFIEQDSDNIGLRESIDA